jgi:hypothetical protein
VTPRTIEDQLREQYFVLLPEMTRIAEHLKTTTQYALLPLSRKLHPYESLIVKARVKQCSSAITKLEQFNPVDGLRNPGAVFDRDRPDTYSLLTLRDLVGIRVMAFPSRIAAEADQLLRSEFPGWEADPITIGGKQIALKFNGQVAESRQGIWCEYQIVPTLIGLFWDVEHAAIYKQAPNLKGLEPVMREQTSDVYLALKAFEGEFEVQLQKSESSRLPG